MSTNSYWRLDRRPEGNDYESALTLVTEPLADLAAGEVRIRNAYLSMDAGTRMWMTDQLSAIDEPMRLVYAFEKSGTFEPGFQDRVTLDVTGFRRG